MLFQPISPTARRELQITNVRRLAALGEPKFVAPWAPYTSGQVGPYFMQSASVLRNGPAFRGAVNSLVELIGGTLPWTMGANDVFDFHGYAGIAGGESRDWPFSYGVATILSLAHAKLYKDGSVLPDGLVLPGTRFIGVSDLNNEGSSWRDKWVPTLQRAGASVDHAFFYVDRMEEGVTELAKLGIERHAVVPMDALTWQVLKDIGHLSDGAFAALNTYSEDRRAWAQTALLTHPQPLITLLTSQDPKKVAKGTKILTHGYPELRDAIVERMREEGYRYEV